MKRQITRAIGILAASSLLASCITVVGDLQTSSSSKENGQRITHRTAGFSLDEKGVNGARGTSESSTANGTNYQLDTSDKSSEAYSMVKEQLLSDKEIEGKDKHLETLLEETKRYNRRLDTEITDIENAIIKRKNKRSGLIAEQFRVRRHRDDLRQNAAKISAALRKGTLTEANKKQLQNELANLDREDQRLSRIYKEIQVILESDPVVIGGKE